MKFKLDENLGTSVRRQFEAAGHDTSTVHQQHLDGVPDRQIYDVCRAEARALVTLDLDFSNPITFDPRPTSGIAVLRLAREPSPSGMAQLVATLLAAVARRSIAGALWIVRGDRIRVWVPKPGD